MGSLREGTAGIEVFRYCGIVPICEVGNEIQQSEAEDVPMSLFSAVESPTSCQRLPLDPGLMIAALTERLVADSGVGEICDYLRSLVSKILRAQWVSGIGPKGRTNHRSTSGEWPPGPPNVQGRDVPVTSGFLPH